MDISRMVLTISTLWRANNNKMRMDGVSIFHYLPSDVRSRRRSFRIFRFAVYPVSHANFASFFRKLSFRSFAFRISQITHSLFGLRQRYNRTDPSATIHLYNL